MEKKHEMSAAVLAQVEVFEYLKERGGNRKTKMEAYCDLLDKSVAGFVSPTLKKRDYDLAPYQCHVTVSDLAVSWHWHRATVRSFLDAMEAFGLLKRIKLIKSIVITMTVQSGHSAFAEDVQQTPCLATQLREVLSVWVIGKSDSAATGAACGQLVRRAMAEAGVQDTPCSGVHVSVGMSSRNDDPQAVAIRATAMGSVALAAMRRVLRRSRFDDGLELMDFFRLDLGGGWTSLIETSKELAGLIFDAEACATTVSPDEEAESLRSFRKPFLALAAKVLEEAD